MDNNTDLQQDQHARPERPDATPEPMPADQQHQRQGDPIAGVDSPSHRDESGEDTLRDEDVLGEQVVGDQLTADAEQRDADERGGEEEPTPV